MPVHFDSWWPIIKWDISFIGCGTEFHMTLFVISIYIMVVLPWPQLTLLVGVLIKNLWIFLLIVLWLLNLLSISYIQARSETQALLSFLANLVWFPLITCNVVEASTSSANANSQHCTISARGSSSLVTDSLLSCFGSSDNPCGRSIHPIPDNTNPAALIEHFLRLAKLEEHQPALIIKFGAFNCPLSGPYP